MIAGLVAALSGSRVAQRVVHVVLSVATVGLLLLACRRSGERLGRVLEQRETLERSNEVQRKMLEAAARRPRNRGELAERLRQGRC
jgi:hypothetical protein